MYENTRNGIIYQEWKKYGSRIRKARQTCFFSMFSGNIGNFNSQIKKDEV